MTRRGPRRALVVLPALVSGLTIGGCASAPTPVSVTGAAGAVAPAMGSNPADPWEAWNRKVFAFNDALDATIVKPVATAYRDVLPQIVRTGIDNVLGNLGDVWSMANHFLQGKVETGLEMGMRVLTNTLFGLGGVLDPATELKLPKRSEDFGQTLGVWGLPAGPYIVLPLLGPSSLRDAAGLPLDRYATMTSHVVQAEEWALSALQLVNVRSELLATTKLVGDVSLDPYVFVRDAYLARRLDQVYDGAPPLEKMEDDGADAPPPPPKKGS